MAQAARAYAYPQHERSRAAERPRVRVVPGAAPRTPVETMSAAAITLAKAIAVVLVLATIVGFARVALNTATVTTSMASQEITSELASARSAAATLEVQQSTLSNPSRIKTEATDLGMAAPASTTTIVLSQDVVATTDDGALSLAKSIRLAAGAAS